MTAMKISYYFCTFNRLLIVVVVVVYYYLLFVRSFLYLLKYTCAKVNALGKLQIVLSYTASSFRTFVFIFVFFQSFVHHHSLLYIDSP